MTALSTLLSHQHGILTSLKSLISAEKQALQAQDADKLLKLAQEKQQCLIALKTNDESLANHPEHSLLTTDPELVEKVSAAKAILADCKDINQQNSQYHQSKGCSHPTGDGKHSVKTITLEYIWLK